MQAAATTAGAALEPQGRCASCTRWGTRGGTFLPPTTGCLWLSLDGSQLTPQVRELLAAVAPLLATSGRCPGHAPFDPAEMPDASWAVDLPRLARRGMIRVLAKARKA